MNMKNLDPAAKIIGLCTGLGVSLYPFKGHIIRNIEPRSIFHTLNDEQWNSNFEGIPLIRNEFTFETDPNLIIISSPDCGSGSMLRMSRSKEMGDHRKNESLMLFFEGIWNYNPKIILFENLEGLFKSFPKNEFQSQLANYRLIIHNESVAIWGNSQKSRKRLVIIAIRRDLPEKIDKEFAKLPKCKGKLKKCRKLYGDLRKQNVSLGHVREDSSLIIAIHARRKMSLEEIRLEWRYRLKGKKRWYTENGEKFKTAPGVYRNLNNDYPATARKANRQFNHRGLTLTPRQLARIMGVPDDFKIYIDPKRKNYWINKARTCITKGMCYEVSNWFKQVLIKTQPWWLE